MYLRYLITQFLETREPLLAKGMAWELVELIQIMEVRRCSRSIPRLLIFFKNIYLTVHLHIMLVCDQLVAQFLL
jgi:hypothetical protein